MAEKQRLLQIVAEKNLKKLRGQHDRFLNRYYDYQQTDFKDGPAARYRKEDIEDDNDSDVSLGSSDQERAMSPRTDLIQQEVRRKLIQQSLQRKYSHKGLLNEDLEDGGAPISKLSLVKGDSTSHGMTQPRTSKSQSRLGRLVTPSSSGNNANRMIPPLALRPNQGPPQQRYASSNAVVNHDATDHGGKPINIVIDGDQLKIEPLEHEGA